MFNNKIDFDKVTDDFEYEKLPDGRYLVKITYITKNYWANKKKVDISFDDSIEDSNTVLTINYEVAEGELKFKKSFYDLHMWAENETRQNISRSTFKKICKAIGVNANAATPKKLVNKLFYITLEASKNDDRYQNITKAEATDKEFDNEHLQNETEISQSPSEIQQSKAEVKTEEVNDAIEDTFVADEDIPF